MTEVNYWLIQPELWLLIGMGFVVGETLFGAAYLLLSLGFASLVVSALLFLQENEIVVFWLNDWSDISITYGVVSLISVLLLRFFFQNSVEKDDINKY